MKRFFIRVPSVFHPWLMNLPAYRNIFSHVGFHPM